MIERPRRPMTLYERRRMSKSPYIKYDKSSKLWIQHRKVVYLYWFKFLQHAERGEFNVNWRKYRKWGGRSGVMESKFDDWWKDHWEPLFSFPEGQPEKAPFHTKKKPEISAMRTALLIYENQHRGSLWDVGCWVAKREKLQKGRELPKALQGGDVGFYAMRDEGESVEDRATQDIWEIDSLISDLLKEGQETSGFGKAGREVKNARIRKAKKEKDMMGIDGRKSWVTLDPNDPLTRENYLRYEDTASQLKDLRQIKKRVQGYISRYLKQANELMTNISEGSLDPS